MIEPDWPAPTWVRARATTRAGGFSAGPYAALNLGVHVGDDPQRVAENRGHLMSQLPACERVAWLQQVHGTDAVDAASVTVTDQTQADASWCTQPGVACAVLTADCLPVLFCSRSSAVVGAAHAGWRGLLSGVLESTVAGMQGRPEELMAWMGPAIGPRHFEVGHEVRDQFLSRCAEDSAHFAPSPAGRWLADLYGLAARRLRSAGLGWIGGGGYCTYAEDTRFFSYRRSPVCGRMASLIWIAH